MFVMGASPNMLAPVCLAVLLLEDLHEVLHHTLM